MNKIAFSVWCLVFFAWAPAHAGLLLQADYITLSDTLGVTSTTGTDSSSSFYNADVMFTVNNSKSLAFGWAVLGVSNSSKVASSTVDYSSSDMGPAVKYTFGKDGGISVLAAYGLICSGSYKITGSSAETWSGSSLFGQMAFESKLSETFRVSFSVNYYSASYTTKVVSKLESSIGYTKTAMFPMVGLIYQW